MLLFHIERQPTNEELEESIEEDLDEAIDDAALAKQKEIDEQRHAFKYRLMRVILSFTAIMQFAFHYVI